MNLRYLKWGWLLAIMLAGTPFLGLIGMGSYWLYQQPYFRDILVLMTACGGVAVLIVLKLRKWQAQVQPAPLILNHVVLSPADEIARERVDELAASYWNKPDKALNFDSSDEWLALGKETLAIVAAIYKPDIKNPELEIPVTSLLIIAEKVTQDIRLQLLDKVPFSDILTLNDGFALVKWKTHLQYMADIAGMARWAINPPAAMAAMVNKTTQEGISQVALSEFKKWLVKTYILKVGYYAIELYSGRLAATSKPINSLQSSATERDLAHIGEQTEKLANEPLRILIAGQTNAGKSTLINRLFTHLRAPDDSVPCTREVTAYHLKSEALEGDHGFEGILMDTPGYGVGLEWLQNYEESLDQVDLLFLVCSVRDAAREADRVFLEAFKAHFTGQLQRRLPPIIVVATHIDQIRPVREWSPPYNIVEPDNTKAVGIRAALQAIRSDLQLDQYDADIVPVCLTHTYNIDILWLALAERLDDAHKAKVLRMQEVISEQGKYQTIVRQFIQGGRWLLRELKQSI